jgi:hypothetical protein
VELYGEEEIEECRKEAVRYLRALSWEMLFPFCHCGQEAGGMIGVGAQ